MRASRSTCLHAVPLAGLIIARNYVAGRPLLSSDRPAGSSAWELALAVLYVAAAAVASVWAHERVVTPLTRWLDRRYRFWAPAPPAVMPGGAPSAAGEREATGQRRVA